MTRAYVGLGANLGEPQPTIEEAIREIGALRGVAGARPSALYRSAPVGFAGQADFVNAVLEIDTTLPADALLESLQAIERRHGRERSFQNAPRTLDLDLLLYGDAEISSPGLSVPHPRMHERAFVLLPLLEIAPEARIPGRGRAADLLKHCGNQRVERIA